MLGFSLLLFPLMFTARRIARWEGVVLLAAYGLYIAVLLESHRVGVIGSWADDRQVSFKPASSRSEYKPDAPAREQPAWTTRIASSLVHNPLAGASGRRDWVVG